MNLCSCGALSWLVLLEFLPAGFFVLAPGLLQSLRSSSIWTQLYGVLLGLPHLPGLAAFSAAHLPALFPSCLISVPAVDSLTSLTLRLGSLSRSLTHKYIVHPLFLVYDCVLCIRCMMVYYQGSESTGLVCFKLPSHCTMSFKIEFTIRAGKSLLLPGFFKTVENQCHVQSILRVFWDNICIVLYWFDQSFSVLHHPNSPRSLSSNKTNSNQSSLRLWHEYISV